MFPAVPFYPFVGEGSPTKIDYRQKGTLSLTSLLEDLRQIWPGGPVCGSLLRRDGPGGGWPIAGLEHGEGGELCAH